VVHVGGFLFGEQLPASAGLFTDRAFDGFPLFGQLTQLSIKGGQGKRTLSLPYRQWMDKAIADLKLTVLPVTVEYAERQSMLPLHHKDPFDRLVVAQARVEAIPLVSTDSLLDQYGITRLW